MRASDNLSLTKMANRFYLQIASIPFWRSPDNSDLIADSNVFPPLILRYSSNTQRRRGYEYVDRIRMNSASSVPSFLTPERKQFQILYFTSTRASVPKFTKARKRPAHLQHKGIERALEREKDPILFHL